MIRFYEGAIVRENFKISRFRKVLEKIFGSRQKYKDERLDLMQKLVKLTMISLYGAQIRRDINESSKCKSEHWMQKKYDDKVSGYRKLPNGNYNVKMKKEDGLEGDNDVKNTLLFHLGTFILNNRKRIMNFLIKEINGFYNKGIYYGDTDSTCIEKIMECIA